MLGTSDEQSRRCCSARSEVRRIPLIVQQQRFDTFVLQPDRGLVECVELFVAEALKDLGKRVNAVPPDSCSKSDSSVAVASGGYRESEASVGVDHLHHPSRVESADDAIIERLFDKVKKLFGVSYLSTPSSRRTVSDRGLDDVWAV